MTANADIGVVVPLYNKRTTINRALASIMAQELRPGRIVVIDDGSTDGSADAIDPAFGTAIDLVRVENGGPGEARNRGAARCGGTLIAFLDADDAWKPGYLAAAAAALAENPACAAYVAAYDVGAMTGIKREELRALFPSSGPYEIGFAKEAWRLKSHIDAIHSSSTVVRRTAFERFGGFFAEDRCTYGEDSWLWLQIAFAGPIYFDRTRRTDFHVEDSALGHARAGTHPMLPVLRRPDTAREAAGPQNAVLLERLLAYYRLIETEKRSAAGDCGAVAALRRQFPWPTRPSARLMAREWRVRLRCLGLRST